ncbi:hypothetical protein C1Y41_10810 [Pantoea sp. ICBG 1758]|nr:hypothetical protein C1Y41_10810 [Pantoea sp. ICBG 1758]
MAHYRPVFSLLCLLGLGAKQRGAEKIARSFALSSARLGAAARGTERFRPPGFWQFQRRLRTRTG